MMTMVNSSFAPFARVHENNIYDIELKRLKRIEKKRSLNEHPTCPQSSDAILTKHFSNLTWFLKLQNGLNLLSTWE